MQREEHSSFTLVALKGPSSMGMIRLIDSLMQSEETDFRVEIVNEPIQVRKRMLDGSADFVILPTTMAALTYNKGLEYQLIAIPVWGTLYLTGTDTSLFGWNLLKGKKVHSMARGMSPDVVFRHLLNKNGLDTENDVTLDYRFPTHIDLAHAVAAGQAGYAILSEPQLSVAMHRNPDLKPLLNLNEAWMQHHGAPMA
ncbi:MAG TPA: hypothetical protein PLK12_15980, partial [Prolixibacteraceae bacterium]|nr:hypothetical protein [Prolixibacteraceae bacterium]